ncbi:uncharacterized protein DNG_09786 [Cephalotrichum gorgonifer]|uniref:N-acetyltransferase domain-containing protein n=1 Tax=Cephalotrichum gorgonifer TaxID=2041049 RepID=A0AAE8N8M7_9PEZI|nr:uncharacterized protein DNG_09786 [Cephalotrichum gorgonifer]
MTPPVARTTIGAVVSHATPDDIPAVVGFNKAARTTMFPMIDSASHDKHADRELATFQQIYLEHPDGAFLIARVDGVLVATIGCVPYDHRFPHLRIGKEERIVEVVRLYVDPALRRTGLASRMFAALEETVRQRGIERFYLHTHPFLPGAVNFWERHGFSTAHVDSDDLIWRTIHMVSFRMGGNDASTP